MCKINKFRNFGKITDQNHTNLCICLKALYLYVTQNRTKFFFQTKFRKSLQR